IYANSPKSDFGTEVRLNRFLANPRFTSFLERQGDQLICKFCTTVLPADSNMIHHHINSVSHFEKVNPDGKINLKNPQRLKILQRLVKRYPEFDLVTQKLIHQNEILEHYLPEDERHLQ